MTLRPLSLIAAACLLVTLAGTVMPLTPAAGLLPALAPAAAAAPPALDEPLPLDPKVRYGRLDNGITYYIRSNPKPEHLAEIRLAVNAGSVLEAEDQRGLAHFLEHMAFNGTEHFPGNGIITFLESIGSRFGPDINAYTSFDETVYLLEVPTNKEGLLDDGFLVLSDWANGMTIAPEDVDEERGVIMEEWRLGRGARERVRKVQWPVLYKGSRYAERLPIGLPEVIETAPARRLRDFYETWYQPDLMAVVAVGDFDADSVEVMIRDRFGGIAAPAEETVRPVYDVPSYEQPLVSVASDEELQTTSVSVTFKHAPSGSELVGDYRRTLITALFSDLLNARLTEISQLPDAPFLFAGSGAGSGVRTVDMYRVYAVTAEGKAERGLESLLTEIARVRAHGFGEGEFERGKARIRSYLDRAYNERDKTESGSYAGEYVANFLDDEPSPGIEYEHEVGLALLDGIGLEEIDAAIDRLVHEDGTVILVSGPEKAGAPLPTEDELLAEVERARSYNPPAYVDSTGGEELLSREPEPGTIVERSAREDLGVTIWRLSNDMEIWLKPTDFKNDQILFACRMPGGLSLVDSTVYPSASLATAYVSEAGYGGYTPTELRKLLAGKMVSASAGISDFDERVGGSSTPADLETALQVLYLVITDPTNRPEAFTILTDRYRSLIENRRANPEARFGDAVRLINSRDHYTMRPPTLQWLDEADPETALAFYRDRMEDFRGCRWYFVGAFDPEEIEPLVLRYLGSLPAPHRPPPETRDIGLRFPEGVIDSTVHAGSEEKARVLISWPALTDLDEMEIFRLRMAGDILDIRLREILREELGGTYSVQVGLSAFYTYPEYGLTSVSFGCAPENVESMTARVFEEIERFKTDGPDSDEVATIQEQERRSLEKGLETNGYWLSSFLTLDLLGWDPGRILARRERIDTLTAEALRETLSRYYPPENHTTVVLKPESE